MPGQQPYYLAIKIQPSANDATIGEQYLLLTDIPCIESWSEQIDRISPTDPRLVIKFAQTSALTYPIYMCSGESQIMYAINIWLDVASLENILINAPLINNNTRATNAVFAKIYAILNKKLSASIAPADEFAINQLYYTFASRKFPITERSATSWKKLFVESFDDMNNYLIKIAKGIILASGHESDSYTNMTVPPGDSTAQYGKTIEEFLATVKVNSFKPHVMQFLAWINSAYREFNANSHQKIFNMCMMLVKTGKIAPIIGTGEKKSHVMQLQVRELGASERAEIISVLNILITSGQDMMFVEFACMLLSCERYLFILQLPRIINHLTMCMNRDRRFTSLVAYAISFAMFYSAQIESTSRTAEVYSPFVFSHDSISAFPVFDDISPYVPVGVTNINHDVPFHINGARTPVAVDAISARLDAAMVRPEAKFSIISDINWRHGDLLLTGSRYASALWIGPREREIYAGDYGLYVREYIGYSCDVLDELLNLVDASGEPLLDILGANFSIDSDAVAVQAAVNDLKIQVPPSAIESKELVELNKAFPNPDSRQNVAPEPEKPRGEINPAARELFCKLKFADGFNNHSDIDIGHVGPEHDFDSAAAKLVLTLRKFGRAVALRFQKERNYTWVIVTDFLNYTIDFFHVHYGTGINLVLNYMTSYPRCWFDGVSHFGTAEYVCARMSGINSRYIYTMNDPIYTLMKCARREDISIVLNFNEQTMVKKWLNINMPGVKVIYGNASLTNDFFGSVPSGTMRDNLSKPWIFNPMVMPKSRTKLQIWSKENTGHSVTCDSTQMIFGKKIVVAKSTVFANYMDELGQLMVESRN